MTTPSIVQFRKGDKFFIGEAAIKGISEPHVPNTVFEVKRLIGTAFDSEEVQRNLKKWPYKVLEDQETKRPYIELALKKA